MPFSTMSTRVALVHDLLDQDGGAERVLWALHEIFPSAPIFTAVWNRRLAGRFVQCDVRTSWMQRLPAIRRAPRLYAALYPLAFAHLDLSGFQLVISSASYFAKGIRTPRNALHICYCHTPPNFIWRSNSYFNHGPLPLATAPLRGWLRVWDRWAARRPQMFVANSAAVAARIQTFYHREVAVIAPPIGRAWFVSHERDDYYLVVSRLVDHKRVDLAIRAAGELRMPLCVVGEGRARQRLERLAGPDVRFLGRVTDEELRRLYARAIAVLIPGEEDFGIVPLEAQAAGTPVIAYDAGGARETVIDGVTGIRFRPQSAAALAIAMRQAGQHTWDRERIQANAVSFGEARFRREFLSLVEACWPAGRQTDSNAAVLIKK